MLKDEYKVYEDKMKKSIEAVISDFDTVRAGRANASVLNRISVDYYGTPTPIQQIASVGSPDPRTLVITPWDASALKGIEKAIMASELGINPQNDGKNYIITSGLSVGDRFVVNGVSSLQDGMDIKPLTEAQYAEKLKKTEELGEAQGDLGKLKKAFGK